MTRMHLKACWEHGCAGWPRAGYTRAEHRRTTLHLDPGSGGAAVVVAEHAAEPLPGGDWIS
jgi:hypothetical protein